MRSSLYDDIKSGTNIISGEEYQDIITGVAEVATEMVIKTLGPYGSTTIVDDGTFTYPSKDGWACLNRLRFGDPIYNTIFGIIKQISFNIVSRVGDGTTSALVGANSFLNELALYKEKHDFRQTEFVEAMEVIKNKIIEELKNSEELLHIDQDGDFSDIRRIAEVSSNNNTALSEIIANIYNITHNPNIFVTLDLGNKLDFEVQKGYKLDCKTMNHKAYINTDTGICKKSGNKTFVAIFDHSINYNEHARIISGLSNYANSKNLEFIIIAPYFDDIISNILGTAINSFIQKNQIPNIMMLQVPLSMDIHRAYLSDVVMLTNAQVFDYGKVRAFNVMVHNLENPDEKLEDALLNVEQYKFESTNDLIETCIGYTTDATIAENYIIFQGYENIANPGIYSSTIEEAKNNYNILKDKANKSSTILHKDFMDAHQRYIRLIGQMGIIKVGGISEIEKHCLKDSVDDAVLACKSAYENGYVRGMNLSILSTIHSMKKFEKAGITEDILNIFFNTFYSIASAVIYNKYKIVDNDIKKKAKDIITECIDTGRGYNLVTDKYDEAGFPTVINSISTEIEIINAIVSILSLMLTSDQLLSVNRIYDKKMSRAKIQAQQNEERKLMAKNITEGVINAIQENRREICSFFGDLNK